MKRRMHFSDRAEQGYRPLDAELLQLKKDVNDANRRLNDADQRLQNARAAAGNARSARLSSKLRIAYDSILTNY